MSERAGKDVGLSAAVTSYMEQVLPDAPEERAVIVDEAKGWIGFG